MRAHPSTDLRVVDTVERRATPEAVRLAAARSRRPSLREIADASRAYYIYGDDRAVQDLFRYRERA